MNANLKSYNLTSYQKRVFINLFFINLLFFMAHNLINLMPNYIKSIGGTRTYIGFFLNLTSLSLMLSIILFSEKIPRLNRRITLIVTHSIFLITTFIMFFVDNLILLIFLRIAGSISFVFGFTMDMNIIFDILPPELRKRGIAFFGISGIISNPIGAYIGEFIIRKFGDRYIFVLSSIIIAIAIFLCIFCSYPDFSENKQTSNSNNFFVYLFNKNVLFLNISSFVFGGAFGVVVSFLSLWTVTRLNLLNISYFFTAFTIVAIVFRVFFSWTLDNFSKKSLINFSYFFIFLSLIVLLLLSNIYQLFLIGFLYGVGHSILFPLLSASYIDVADKYNYDKVTLNNIFVAINVGGTIIISFLSGILSDIFNLWVVYLIYSIITLLIILMQLFISNNVKDNINYKNHP